MPNIEESMDTIGHLSKGKLGTVRFTTINLIYAYGQLPLNKATIMLWTFSIVGTYQFKTGTGVLRTYNDACGFSTGNGLHVKWTPSAHAFNSQSERLYLHIEDLNWKNGKKVWVLTECELSNPIKIPLFDMNFSLKKQKNFLNKYPEKLSSRENSSEIEVVNENLEARTTGTVEAKTNLKFSFPPWFTGDVHPPVYPCNIIMRLQGDYNIPRDYKVPKKQDCLPGLF